MVAEQKCLIKNKIKINKKVIAQHTFVAITEFSGIIVFYRNFV